MRIGAASAPCARRPQRPLMSFRVRNVICLVAGMGRDPPPRGGHASGRPAAAVFITVVRARPQTDYVSGPGTYERGEHICSSLLGTQVVLPAEPDAADKAGATQRTP